MNASWETQTANTLPSVMAGLVPAIHAVMPPQACREYMQRPGVDGRDKPGHDGGGALDAYANKPGHDG
ncbi:hypothetical protein [Methylocapsa sp. S129]|uniref:hypothetical protein n=1 Tax=Methylocapsa sp. S129 TaxID=1641869 RepID=UPI00131CA85E|nr:hypothetical protein [Methylocapsa sp. S129]